MSGAVDAVSSLGLDNAATFLRFQLWRPLTASLYLGTPSMAWATSLYLLVKYGQELEAQVGTSAYVKFVVLQIVLLLVVSSAVGLPFTAHGLVTAIIYAWSRLEPFGDVMFQFGIKLKYYALPYGLIVVEMLQKQSMLAALPHVLGILCAHFHHFFAVVWPNLQAAAGGESSLLTPRAKASPLAPRARKLGG